MEETKRLAEFVAHLTYRDLPSEVVEKAKDMILDQLGVQIASSTLPWSVAAYRYARDIGGVPESTIVHYGLKTNAVNAAFVNGTFGHGFETDDTHRRAGTHPGCVIIPAAVAMGERELATGKDILLAVVVGYEIQGRVALAVAPSLSFRGHHPTGSTGSFAAAAVAGKLLGFDKETMLNAISIAANAFAGLTEGTQSRGSLKRTFGGAAGSGGIRAALLAERGLTGPPAILEGKMGFFRAFSDEYHPEEVLPTLGKEFKIMELAYKVYCGDGHIQPMIDALVNILRRRPIRPDEVSEVVIGTNQMAINITGTIREPQDITGAHFSAPFGIGLRIVKGGNGFREFVEENLHDPEVLAVASKVRMEIDEELQRQMQRVRGCRVRVTLKSGESLEERIDDLRILTRPELQDKFRSLASLVMPPSRVEEIIDTVMHLDELPRATTLGILLTR